MLPDLRPDVTDLRAVVTTRWKGNSYRPQNIYSIESFYIDSALDNDADAWNLVLGDPRGELLELAVRDSEVRAQLFGLGRDNFMITGIADTATYTSGSWTLTGRDYSSLATDSTVSPQHFRQVRAWAVVEEQAKKLGFPSRNLAHGRMVRKVFFTDGSESYWDFWYRLYRKEQMWIWCDPDGTLRAGTLNYSDQIDYYLGEPRNDDTTAIRRAHIPVESDGFEIRKSTQQRIGNVEVYWHKGDNGARTIVEDPTTRGWMKRPTKIMLDTDAHSANAAKKTALEEIFEGKVGSVEYTLTVPDVGFPIRQNRIARLNLPDIGLYGQFFVVGTRMVGSPDGFVQEVRLREKQYAITRRIPTDPKLKTNQPSAGAAASGMGAALEGDVPNMPIGWGDYYVKAAKKWHGPWDYQLFLATLIAITDRETGGSFKNERQNGGPGGDHIEWYPYQGSGTTPTTTVKDPLTGNVKIGGVSRESREEWQTKFANEKGDGYINWEAGIGPMQLTDRGLKHEADDLLRANFRDEFSGGRWHPQHNIMVGAHYLRDCLKAMVGDSGRDIDMWAGVTAYNMGVGGAQAYISAHGYPSPYALDVKKKVFTDPAYLADVKNAIQTAQTNYKASSGTPPATFGPLGSMFRYAANILGTPGVGTHSWTEFPNNWQSDNAVDIKTAWLSPVYAVHDGSIGNFGVEPDNARAVYYPTPDSMTKLDRFGGNRVNIEGKSNSTYYAHLARLNTKIIYAGARVKRGDLIGWSGIANGVPHLHFAVKNGDPRQFTPGVSF